MGVLPETGNAPTMAALVHADLPTGSDAFRGSGTRPSLRVVAEWALGDWGIGVMPGILYDRNGDERFWRRVLGSWDRFVVALPFARGVVGIGEFIEIPHDADAETLERLRRRLEDDLNTLTSELDARFGFEAIEAAAPTAECAPVDASDLESVESGR